MLPKTADPLISPKDLCTELGCSRATLYRVIMPNVRVVQISPRRVGVPRSEVERLKAQKTRPAVA